MAALFAMTEGLVVALSCLSAIHTTWAQQEPHESSSGASSSLPKLDNSQYVDQGEVVELGDLPVYTVGNGSRCLIWNYDIFGFDSGRSRQLCDWFAGHGYRVIMPDYYRGTYQDPSWPGTKDFLVQQSNWTNLMSDWEEKVYPFALELGAQAFGTIGTCWGSYPVVQLSTLAVFSAGVSMHPSHSPIINLLGENEKDILNQIKCPQLMMPSKTDSLNVKPGGLTEKVLEPQNLVEFLPFPDMNHGWTTRGDMSDPLVERDVNKAINAALEFLNKNVVVDDA